MGFLSSIVSAVSCVVSAIGSVVSSFCTSVLPRIVPFLDSVGEVVRGIANSVLSGLEVFKPQEDVEELGHRALQAAHNGIKPENYSNFDHYLEEIRAFKLDPNAEFARNEKLLSGLAIGSYGLEKKFHAPSGSMGALWVLAASQPEFFHAERLISLVRSGSNMLTVLHYFDGTLSPTQALRTRQALLDNEQQLAPEKTPEQLYTQLSAVKHALRNSNS